MLALLYVHNHCIIYRFLHNMAEVGPSDCFASHKLFLSLCIQFSSQALSQDRQVPSQNRQIQVELQVLNF